MHRQDNNLWRGENRTGDKKVDIRNKTFEDRIVYDNTEYDMTVKYNRAGGDRAEMTSKC